MPFTSGTYSLPTGNPVVPGTTISSTTTNTTNSDIATALSACLLKDGTQTVTANIPMASHKFTGLSAGTTAGDSVEYAGSPSFTNLAYTATLTGSTGILNIGSGQVYKDASGNVGIGTSSPSSYGKLAVYSDGTTNSTMTLINPSAVNGASLTFIDVNNSAAITSLPASGGGLGFFVNASAERMRIDSSGNMGIGLSAPYGRLSISSTSATGGLHLSPTSTDKGGYLNATGDSELMVSGGASYNSYAAPNFVMNAKSTAASGTYHTGSDIRFWVNTGLTVGTTFNQSEKMRIDSSGNVGIGTTSVGYKLTVRGASACASFQITNTGSIIDFYANTSTYVGAISTNGSSTAFNTTSDYRLKENIEPMAGALSVVQQLNPVTYKWKSDGSDGQGFIAHELQAVVPDCVTGEKDAVNEDGSIKPQGIDTSFLVATLTAAIQELKAIIDTQQEQINSLLGK